MSKPSERRLGPRIAAVAAVSAVLAGIAYSLFRSATSDPVPGSASTIDAAALGERVLVIAPHPDDETINPAGLITQARHRGASVRVVLVTVGDGYRRAAARIATGPVTADTFLRLGELRHSESVTALDELGVPADERIYLAYSDGSLNTLWNLQWDADRPHIGANGRHAVPYAFAYRPGTVYCGANLADDLVGIIEDFKPTTVVYPDANDRHHDHWAAGAFTDYAMERVAYKGLRLSYLTHYGHYPFPWAYVPSAYLRPPAPLEAVGSKWLSLPMAQAEEALKHRAIEGYASQMRVADLRAYLLAFVRRNELFATFEPPVVAPRGSDDPPSTAAEMDAAVVVRQPPASSAARVVAPGACQEVLLARGPSVVWMGIRTSAGRHGRIRYHYGLRLFGSDTRRIDIDVTGGRATPLRIESGSYVPDTIRVETAGDVTWIGLDASVLDGYRSCLVGARTSFPGTLRLSSRAAWRPVRLE